MFKKYLLATLIFIVAFTIDRYVKNIFVEGFTYHNEVFSLVLVYNKGVAFSMLSFLGAYLKWIQIFILSIILIYAIKPSNRDCLYAFSILLVGAISNIYDRFIHEGVVDYIFWHYYFNFPIFNLSDIFINMGVVYLFYISFKDKKYKI